jgi:hypothetical protein
MDKGTKRQALQIAWQGHSFRIDGQIPRKVKLLRLLGQDILAKLWQSHSFHAVVETVTENQGFQTAGQGHPS